MIRPEGIGDVIMISPLLRELNRLVPSARITLVVGPHAFNVVERCPYVERIITYRAVAKVRWWHPLSQRIHAFLFARRELWTESWDLAIMPRWGLDYYDASVIAYFSGAPWRLGYSESVELRKQTLNKGYDRYYTQVVEDSSTKHEVEHNLDILRFIGLEPVDDILELWLSNEDEDFAASLTNPADDRPLIGLAPGAGSEKRLWPIARFVEAAERFVDEYSAKIIILGGPNEEGLGRALKHALGGAAIDIVNGATLRQTAAVLKRCMLFCGNDSGIMHLAAAARTPVVEVSCHPISGDDAHPNSPERFGPWKVPHVILRPHAADEKCLSGCRSGKPHCILNVSVSSVIEAAEKFLVHPDPREKRSHG